MFCRSSEFLSKDMFQKAFKRFKNFMAPFYEQGPPFSRLQNHYPRPAFTCSKLTIETLEQGVKFVQS